MTNSPTVLGRVGFLNLQRSTHSRVEALQSLFRSRRFWLFTSLAVVLAVGLRAPWFGAPLGNDEGGLAYIAAHWQESGPYLYGHSFLDRPPVLVALFGLATETGGTAAVRTIGTVAVALLVVLTALVARELGGPRAGVWGAFIAAILGSSVALGAVFTPAELLAVLPSAASVLLLLVAQRLSRARLVCLALAGCLAIAALLVKQSFGDALFAGVACLATGMYIGKETRRSRLIDAGAYLAGAATAVLCLELWEAALGAPDGATSYALLGFRLDGLGALAGSAGGLPGRFAERLLLPLVGSGLAFVLIWSVVGVRALRGRGVISATVVGWALGGLAGVLLGGSYWSHYLIELIPVAAVTAAVALAVASHRWAGRTAGGLALLAVAATGIGLPVSRATSSAFEAQAVGSSVGEAAHAKDTIYVRYSQANVTYYSGLRNPYPYNWSLMLRAIPEAEHDLRSLLRSAQRPTWIVEWEGSSTYGLDDNGRTAGVLDRRYRPVADPCGYTVLLRRDATRPTPTSGACG